MIPSVVKRLALAFATVAALAVAPAAPASAQANGQFTMDQLLAAGNSFFTQLSGNLAAALENVISRMGGLPNGYILGQTTGGAFILGGRFGEGTLYTQNAGAHSVRWTGGSLGFDFGGDVSQTMMLVYNLPSVDAVYTRFFGGGANAYVVGGLGITVYSRNQMFVVPIVSGVGLRLGAAVGTINFSPN
jgi:hypothetical protein